jgi:hypothetical protein
MSRFWKYLSPLILVSSLSTAQACTLPNVGSYAGAGGGTAYFNGGTNNNNFTFYTSQTFVINLTVAPASWTPSSVIGSYGGVIRSSVTPPTGSNSSIDFNSPSQTVFFDPSTNTANGTVTLIGYNPTLCTGQIRFDDTAATTVSFSNNRGTVTSAASASSFTHSYFFSASQGGSLLTLMPNTALPPSSLIPSDLVTLAFAIELKAQ